MQRNTSYAYNILANKMRRSVFLSKAHPELVAPTRRYRETIYHARNSRSRPGLFKLIRSQLVTALTACQAYLIGLT